MMTSNSFSKFGKFGKSIVNRISAKYYNF